jgi:hypothetical protein
MSASFTGDAALHKARLRMAAPPAAQIAQKVPKCRDWVR